VICGEIRTTEYVSICQGEKYKGWDLNGQYTDTLTAVNGCDSMVTTHLTVHPAYEITEEVTLCEGENYKGWDREGTYREYRISVSGCDSTVTTRLFFYPSFVPEIRVEADTLRADDTYLAYQWRDEAGNIPGANNPEYVISRSGTFTLVATGENGCQHVSEPVQVIHSASPDLTEILKYAVIPNPNQGSFVFRMESGRIHDLTLKLMSATGQVIEERKIRYAPVNHTEEFAAFHVRKGIYFLVISSNDFQKTEPIIIR
jgi:hypothetical protein